MSDQINSIHLSDTFEIIQTADDFYYSPKADRGNPQRLNLNKWRDTITFHLPKSENSEYWALNLLGSREVMHIYKGSQEIYQFEDRTKTTSRLEMDLIGFHVLNDRWVVVLEYCERDRTFICRTHDILKQKKSQSHSLAELRAPSYSDIMCYSHAGEYILVMTSTHIAKIMIAPDDGYGCPKLDYKIMTNNIRLNQNNEPREHMRDISFKQISRSDGTVESKILLHSNSAPLISNSHPSGVYNNLRLDGTRFSQINVYMQRSEYDSMCFHSIRSHNSLIGTINPETLENTGVVPNPTELLQGGMEYLAPDIAIHRPDLHVLTQYITLLAPVQTKQPTPQQKLIHVNIHDYETKKEQRRLYARHCNDDGRFFTMICSKWTDTHWLIYQVDRLTRTIAFMRVKAPASGLMTEIQHGGRIVISKFDLFHETVRVIEPTKTNIASVLTGIPSTASVFIAKFTEQKIINY